MKPCSYTYRALRRIPKILQNSSQDWVKKEERFQILLFICHYSPVTIHLSLFTGTVHPLLFMTLFTPNFAYLRGVVPYVLEAFLKHSLVLISLPLELAFLEREPTCFHYYCSTTTLFILIHYKPCNPTNLVTRTSSSFVTVNL